MATALAAGCRQPSPSSPPTTTAPAETTAPPEVLSDADATARLDRLDAEAQDAVATRDIARLRKTIAEMKAVKARRDETVRRRDELVAALEGELAKLTDALHRFLFAELSEMPLDRRRRVIADAETGRGDPINGPAEALAESVFAAGNPYLLSKKDLKGGSIDPASGLPVRYAGPVGDAWKAQFNAAHNAAMRRLAGQAAQTAPAE